MPLICATLLVLSWLAPASAAADTTSPIISKDAHAEAILWEVWVSDEADGATPRTVMKHYLRISVLDERGVEMLAKIDIPHLGNAHVSDVWAKTTRRNGEIIELKKDGVFERLLAKSGDVKIKMTSLALPGLEPGAIVEYGWRERHDNELANYTRLPLQREYPVKLVRYHIKPLSSPYFPFAMRAQSFHVDLPGFEKEPNGFVGLTFTNLPAVAEEPDMPPENEVTAWILLYYTPDEKVEPERYWTQHGKLMFESYKDRMKANNDVKRKAAELVQGAANDDEKLKRLYMFCRSSIKNVSDQASGLSPEQRRNAKENNNPGDTLKHGVGTGSDIDLLFGALANAAGFDARYAKVADRSRFLFQKRYVNSYFMEAWQIAVRVNDKWKFFDPASTYVPFGMLRWQEEGNTALVSDSKAPEFVQTELSPPDRSARRNLAKFELREDGTLEGNVRVSLTGHQVVARRREYAALKEEERLENLKTDIENQFAGAEISNLALQDVNDPEMPLVWSYHIKIPNYARRSGKRLFIQPAVFKRGYAARYTAESREFPLYFRYPWMDVDHVTIHLPDGYELDHADAPSNAPLGPVAHYTVTAQFDHAKRDLIYQRELVFGKNLALMFKKEAYPMFKSFFDAAHAGDNHTISLRQANQ